MTDTAGGAPRPRLILDCDPGVDDAAALVLAAHFGDLVGVTTVGGNAPLADVTTNALLATQIFGIDVEVHAGVGRPLVGEPLHAPEVHGEHGFAGPDLPRLQRSVASDDAVGWLVETIRAEEGLWLVPTGPLTNVAMALQVAPDLARRVSGISFMGGSATGGNRTAAAEFNALADPEAAAAVVAAPTVVHMAGLDLTMQFRSDDALADALQATGTAGGRLLADLIGDYLDNMATIRGERWGGLHDPCAVLALTHPGLIGWTSRPCAVELAGTHTRGMTLVDRRRPTEEPDDAPGIVRHGHTIDADAARAALVDAVAAHA
ncbi:MAG: nucleoside hydrolase [Actinomycetota bacterium]